ncbi:hypothetical protein GCM10009555_035440 [Acrocarpospora macrocephala]|uniref:Orc1-like AAA ATPase domain-containing protein n=1 Tax=Acrocarpospora macrocephala TaxID=150177 RepID=A0A5M3X4J6_9ACTN|nr:ATP-binding protein [Acrocarpospora macrocephala]GES16647.1 hypothetical protein Amac_102450 [Acrocarpospora macrocephala]
MCADIVGLQAELQAVAGFLDSIAVRSAALVLEGEAGIGKTTLWLAAGEEARRRGFCVLTTAPGTAEAQLSYASLADLLTHVESSVFATLPEPRRRAIDILLLRDGADDVLTDRRATGAGLLSVIERLADKGPVLLAIDDLQWVDSSSAGAIQFAVRWLRGRVGMLATLRTEDQTEGWAREHGAPGSWLRLLDPDASHRLRVGPLGPAVLHGVLHGLIGRSAGRAGNEPE